MTSIRLKGQVEQQWNQIAQETGLDQAAVGIAWQQNSLARLADGQKRCLQQPRRTIDAVPAAGHTHCYGRLVLTGPHSSLRFEGAADLGKFGQVPYPRTLPQQLAQRRWQSSPATVGRQEQGRPSRRCNSGSRTMGSGGSH